MTDKGKIVLEFMKRGVLLSPEQLNEINEGNVQEFLEKMAGKKENKAPIEKNTLKITFTEPQKKVHAEGQVRIHMEGFREIRDLIAAKVNAVSINKARSTFGLCTVIGRVKSLTGDGFIIEDETGETEVRMKDMKEIRQGDILGLEGAFRGNEFIQNSIIWPEVPLPKDEIEYPDGEIILTTEKGISGPGVVNIHSGPELSEVTVEDNEAAMAIIAYRPKESVTKEEAVMILRKRVIPIGSLAGKESFLARPPAVFWLAGNESFTKNYKGIMIVSTGNGMSARLTPGRPAEIVDNKDLIVR